MDGWKEDEERYVRKGGRRRNESERAYLLTNLYTSFTVTHHETRGKYVPYFLRRWKWHPLYSICWDNGRVRVVVGVGGGLGGWGGWFHIFKSNRLHSADKFATKETIEAATFVRNKYNWLVVFITEKHLCFWSVDDKSAIYIGAVRLIS